MKEQIKKQINERMNEYINECTSTFIEIKAIDDITAG